jgi:hypothetical protein
MKIDELFLPHSFQFIIYPPIVHLTLFIRGYGKYLFRKIKLNKCNPNVAGLRSIYIVRFILGNAWRQEYWIN